MPKRTGLHLFMSNRLEVLAERLAELVRIPPSLPLQPEVVIVQSKGMERWVSMELAEHNGVCANAYFPFPNACLEDIFKKMKPDFPEMSPFEPEMMTFRLMGVIPRLPREEDRP